MRKTALLLAALTLLGCGEEFDPASYVDGLRLLAVAAELPEIAPADDGRAPAGTTVRSLLADPLQLEDPEREAIVVHVACTPTPGSVEPSLCTAVEFLSSPAQIGEFLGAGEGLCDGEQGAPDGTESPISFVGLESCDHVEGCAPAVVSGLQLPAPSYELPGEFTLNALPSGHPQRLLGVQVVILSVALQAGADELVADADPSDPCTFGTTIGGNLARLLKERDYMTAVKRIQVRGPDNDDPINVNPSIGGLTADGEILPPVGAEPAVWDRKSTRLLPLLPTDETGQPLDTEQLFQPFVRRGAEGEKVEDTREKWLYSWYATSGELDELRTRSHTVEQRWTAPKADERPAHGRIFVYAVVRDARGGMDWTRHEVLLDF